MTVGACGRTRSPIDLIATLGVERLPVDELIAKANIAHLRQLLNDAELTGFERERAVQRLAREEAKLFARSLRDLRAVRA
uniref:Uncharacterized protein n=1 Tax=Rhodopseudomonas palustris (strain BisA53) TaxID=316055 RepID=Q07QD1_RHOP5